MKLNCKPGDLARIIHHPTLPEYADRIVRCVRTHVHPRGRIGWIIEPRLPCGCDVVADDLLRPIRDPGDDAVDETLTWLPSPVKEVA